MVSTVYSGWAAQIVLGAPSGYPRHYSLASAASYLFPHSVQAYHDQLLEPLFGSIVPRLQSLQATIPAPLALALLAAFDVALLVGFAGWAACGVKGAVALIAVGVVAATRRVAKKA